ncbi:MAG: methylated-DNA--[protein]-cysteine S-methyltransferase [Bacteroidota bacterium]
MQQKAYCSSPFGCFEITGSERGIRRVQLSKKQHCPDQEVPAPLRACVQQLKEYFARQRTDFDLQLDWGDAPEFHQAVWEQLTRIPYGHTTSYSGIAHRLGDANKMRAVGQANRSNPIAIIVPCHRVIAKNGDLQGYFYGLDMKRKLLELENPMSFATQGQLF